MVIHQTTYNHFHNILRLFDVFTNISFTASERCAVITYKHSIMRVASRVVERLKTLDLWKLGNIRKVSKLHRMIA